MFIARFQRMEKELLTAYGFVSPLTNEEPELFTRHDKNPRKYPCFVRSIPRLYAIIQEVAPEGRGRIIFRILTLLQILA